MSTMDARRLAVAMVAGMRDATVRAALRAFYRGADDEALRVIGSAVGVDVRLGDPAFREWLLEALEYRVSPPDEELDEDSQDTEIYAILEPQADVR